MNKVLKFCFFKLYVLCFLSIYGQVLPEGFELEEHASGIIAAGGIVFADESHHYVWDLSGKIYLIENGQRIEPPVIDLSEEVGFWHDHGLVSVALDPAFQQNGRIYLYYTVDRHHLLHYDTPEYHPDSNLYFDATIARLTRYEIDLNDFDSTIPNSRHILLGSEISNGVPILYNSHTGGTVHFGNDGSLLLSTGDGNDGDYNGQGIVPEAAYDLQGIEDGIISQAENVGAYRAQQVQSLSGKILRINPETGEGYSTNPFFDEDQPSSAASLVWSLGLRHPFRICVRPFTGSSNPETGQPGDIYIGDVGYYRWEEINLADGPGINFGWPQYEGMGTFWSYDSRDRPNFYSPNPLFNGTSCDDEYFSFHTLIQPPLSDHSNAFLNPCDFTQEISSIANTFVHERPVLAWRNNINQGEPYTALIPSFNGDGEPVFVELLEEFGEDGSFTGSASIGGDFYYGLNYPEEYFSSYFHSDFSGWIRTFKFNESNELTEVKEFGSEWQNIVQVSFNPYDGNLYFTKVFPGTVYKLTYGGNRAPRIVLDNNVFFGPSPLSLEIDASQSFDLDEDPLSFYWILDNDTIGTSAILNNEFISMGSSPEFQSVLLSLRDTADNESTEEITISLNNTPPNVEITSSSQLENYSGITSEQFNLNGLVTDNEHSVSELEYNWTLILHHNNHFHILNTDVNTSTQLLTDPLGCDETGEYYYRIVLEVEDAAGLKGQDEKSLFPDCEGNVTIPPSDQFYVFPNPGSDYLTLKGDFDLDPVQIRIYNAMGQLVKEETILPEGNNNLPIEILNLKAGFYILNAEVTGSTQSMRFLKRDL